MSRREKIERALLTAGDPHGNWQAEDWQNLDMVLCSLVARVKLLDAVVDANCEHCPVDECHNCATGDAKHALEVYDSEQG